MVPRGAKYRFVHMWPARRGACPPLAMALLDYRKKTFSNADTNSCAAPYLCPPIRPALPTCLEELKAEGMAECAARVSLQEGVR